MVTLLRREFTVNIAREAAWGHLVCVEKWPSWAKHIKQIDLTPSEDIGPTSKGVIHLRNHMKSAFTMTEFDPPHHWKWAGSFLWLTIHYDHIFESLEPQRTKLTWILEAEGVGVSTLGVLFARIYSKNLDRAIPALARELNAGQRMST
jgi:hypothetical protein